jgi:stage II sporulation protein AA (anti-sigma F factor antagonist)
MVVASALKNGNLEVSLDGELDEGNIDVLRAEIDKYRAPDSLVFDLKKLAFMDSTGVGFFINRYKKGTPISVKNLTQQVEKIFRMSGLFNIIRRI